MLGVDPLEPHQRQLRVDDVLHRTSHMNGVSVRLIQLGHARFHFTVGPRRPNRNVGAAAIAVLPLVLFPMRVGPAAMPPVILVSRVVPSVEALAVESRKDPDQNVSVILVIAEVILDSHETLLPV